MKSIETIVCLSVMMALGSGCASNQETNQETSLEIAAVQADWYEKYKTQENTPVPSEMLLNTDKEPDLSGKGFVDLFNGTDLSDWTPRGGFARFEAVGNTIVGTCDPKSPSTYLSTNKNDYRDFIFTCEMFWEVDGNSGVQFRSHFKPGKDAAPDDTTKQVVIGPQVEMEGVGGFSKGRFWSGGIYGQNCGGYFYPVWLQEHETARTSFKPGEWNRVTLKAKGNVVKTWVNGIPVSHWVGDGTYPKGFFSLQIHSGKQGKVIWRGLRVKELSKKKYN